MLNNPRLNRYDNILDVLPTGKASGAIAAFDCGADGLPIKALTVQIDPVQDLHGYDAPWPAGGGVNKFDGTYVSGVLSQGANVWTYQATAGRTAIISCSPSTTYTVKKYAESNRLSIGTTETAPAFGDTVNILYSDDGTQATVTTPANAHYLLVYVSTSDEQAEPQMQVEVGSTTATAWTPYSNICPISGRTGANAFRTGVNVWDEEWELGTYNANGAKVENSAYIRSKNMIPVVPGERYYYKAPDTGRVVFYKANGDFISRSATMRDVEITIPADCRYITFFAKATTYNNDISINYPSTDHDYHAYNGKVYALTFKDENDNPITVYGGNPTYLGSGNWRLTVTMAEVDLGSLAWTYSSNTQLFFAEVSGKKVGRYNIICSMYPTSTATSISGIADKEVAGGGSTVQVLVKDSSYIDAASFTAAVTGQQLVYELATPVTYTLTTEELTSLLRDNNVWADCGDVEAEIRLDIGLALDKLTNAVLSLGSNT